MAFENRNRKQELRCNKLQKELSFENSLFTHESVYYFLRSSKICMVLIIAWAAPSIPSTLLSMLKL